MRKILSGNPIAAGDNVEGATNNTSATFMRGRGGSVQAAFNQALFGHENHLIVSARITITPACILPRILNWRELTDNRGTIGSGIFTRDNKVRLNTSTETFGIYFSESFDITEKLTATVASRYNHISIQMANQFIDGEDKLSGEHSFDRFNPSGGLTYQMLDNLNLYGGYSESSRVPTPMELSCADPEMTRAACPMPSCPTRH